MPKIVHERYVRGAEAHLAEEKIACIQTTLNISTPFPATTPPSLLASLTHFTNVVTPPLGSRKIFTLLPQSERDGKGIHEKEKVYCRIISFISYPPRSLHSTEGIQIQYRPSASPFLCKSSGSIHRYTHKPAAIHLNANPVTSVADL